MKKNIRNIYISRRNFLKAAGAGIASLTLGGTFFNCSDDEAQSETGYFYFAVIADTHIIDEYYTGPEGNELDTKTIFETIDNYTDVKNFINSLSPEIEMVFVAGDYFHNYPSNDIDFYYQNRTRLNIAHEISSQFNAPVYPGFGNHDYNLENFSRENSHELFKNIFGADPYYKIDYKGWKFIHANNMLGETCNPESDKYNPSKGSFGEEQLNWIESELDKGKPTVIIHHYPLMLIEKDEKSGLDYFSLIEKYSDTIKADIGGHMHTWIEYENKYGPRAMLAGSTRFDRDNYLIFRVDRKTNEFEILNLNVIDWGTRYADPYI